MILCLCHPEVPSPQSPTYLRYDLWWSYPGEPLSFGEEGQASPGTAIVNLSSLDAYLWLEVQDTGDLKLRVAKGFPLSESTAGSGFDWDDSDVHAQADRCGSA